MGGGISEAIHWPFIYHFALGVRCVCVWGGGKAGLTLLVALALASLEMVGQHPAPLL